MSDGTDSGGAESAASRQRPGSPPAQATSVPTIFDYRTPDPSPATNVNTKLGFTDRGTLLVGYHRRNHALRVHCNLHLDVFFFVLSGHARFYNEEGDCFAELRTRQGVVIPRGTPYRFEDVEDDAAGPLEIIRFAASEVPLTSEDFLSSREEREHRIER